MSPSIARDVFDVLAARAPEALPRRLGGYEPLQFKLDLVGPEGFVSQWNEETMGLFWKTTKPFVGGHTFGLASEVGRPPSPTRSAMCRCPSTPESSPTRTGTGC